MNVFEIFIDNNGDKKVVGHGCGKCNRLWLDKDLDSKSRAKNCCISPTHQRQCPVCKKISSDDAVGLCLDCAKLFEQVETSNLFRSADEVDSCDCGYLTDSHRFWGSVAEYKNDCLKKGIEPLPFLFLTKPHYFKVEAKAVVKNIIEGLISSSDFAHPNAYTWIKGKNRLSAAVDEFSNLNKGIIGWDADYSKKISTKE